MLPTNLWVEENQQKSDRNVACTLICVKFNWSTAVSPDTLVLFSGGTDDSVQERDLKTTRI